MSVVPPSAGSLRPAPDWMAYLDKLQSIVDHQTSLLADLRSVTPADPASASQLSSVISRMDGFISGLQLSLALSPNVPTSRAVTSPGRAPPPAFPPSAPKPSPSKPSPPSYKQTLLTQKQQAITKLQAKHPVKYEPSRQLIFEPFCPDLRTQPISDLKFLREAEGCLADDLQVSSPVELVRRLPRGGFRIQFSTEAFSLLQSSEPTLELRTLGQWTLWHSPNPTSGKSLVLNPVPHDISDSELLQELVYANHTVHNMPPEEVKQQVSAISRLQFRNRDTKALQDSRSVRVFCDTPLYDKLLSSAGVFLGHRAVHARPYTPPRYRCYKCNAVGSHKAEFCRSQRLPPAQHAPNVASSSQAPPPDQGMELDSGSPSPRPALAQQPPLSPSQAALPVSPAPPKKVRSIGLGQQFLDLMRQHPQAPIDFERSLQNGLSEIQAKKVILATYTLLDEPSDDKDDSSHQGGSLLPNW